MNDTTKMFRPARSNQLRHIQVARLGSGWIVGEATLDNAQFFYNATHAEAAAINLGQRLTDAGEPTEIHLSHYGGRSEGQFIVVAIPTSAIT